MKRHQTKKHQMEEQQMEKHQVREKIKCGAFTAGNFEDEVLHSDRPVLVVFRADWSGTCHIMTPILDDLCHEFEGIAKIGMVDIDTDMKLAKEFGISSIPSLVFYKGGEVVDHITGSVPRNIITQKLNDIVSKQQ